jgi:hypothetical protein
MGKGKNCSFTGIKKVRYGADGRFVYGVYENGVRCSNETFGVDPARGVKKHCYVEDMKWNISNIKNWNFCANEGSRCQFMGIKAVRYGADNRFSYNVFSNGEACSNGAFGGDPARGVKKHCYVGELNWNLSSTGAYKLCSNEGKTCSFNGIKAVRYGADGRFRYGVFLNSILCNNLVFGDPAPGIQKHCYIADL